MQRPDLPGCAHMPVSGQAEAVWVATGERLVLGWIVSERDFLDLPIPRDVP